MIRRLRDLRVFLGDRREPVTAQSGASHQQGRRHEDRLDAKANKTKSFD